MDKPKTYGGACSCSGSVVVPFLNPPPIVTYNYAAFFSGSMMTGSLNGADLFSNYFLQICSPSLHSDNHHLGFVPGLGIDNAAALGVATSVECYPRNVREMEEFIEHCVRSKMIVRVVIDEFYLPARSGYGRFHFSHDNVAYGYCRHCSNIALLGSCRLNLPERHPLARYGRFGESRITVAQFANAMFSNQAAKTEFDGKMVGFLPNRRIPKLDVPCIKRQLEDYIGGVFDPQYYREAGFPEDALARQVASHEGGAIRRFGLNIYGALEEQLRGPTVKEGKPVDVRTYRFLWEHKVLMRNRMKALAADLHSATLAKLFPLFDMIEAAANHARLLAIAFALRRDAQSRDALVSKLAQLRLAERAALSAAVVEI